MDAINEREELISFGRDSRWRPPLWVIVVVLVIVGALAAILTSTLSGHGHSPGRAAPESTSATTPAVIVPPSPSVWCTPQQADSLLHAFVREFDAGHAAASSYLAGAYQFALWWDPTLPPGAALGGGSEYPTLISHLRALHQQGIRLALTGFSGQPGAGGIGFVVGVHRVPAASARPRPMSAHGVLDCATGRFTTLVIDEW